MSCKTIFLRGLALILLALFLLSPDTFACFLPVIIGLWLISIQKPKSEKKPIVEGVSRPREGVIVSDRMRVKEDDFVWIIRFSQDPAKRQKALQKLKELGLAEEL